MGCGYTKANENKQRQILRHTMANSLNKPKLDNFANEN